MQYEIAQLEVNWYFLLHISLSKLSILAKFFFCVFMGRDGVEVHKHAKKERGQFGSSCSLTEVDQHTLTLQNMQIYIFLLNQIFLRMSTYRNCYFKLLFLLHHVVMFPATRAYNLKGNKGKRYDKKADKDTIKEGKSR